MSSKQKDTHRVDDNPELIERFVAGDKNAFEEIQRRAEPLVFSTAYKVLHHHEDTQDVMQEVLVKIWKKRTTYNRKKGSLTTWICTMTRNAAIDRVRHVRRRSSLLDRATPVLRSVDKIKHYESTVTTSRRDLYRQIAQTLKDLPREQYECIVLHFFSGLTQKEIAEQNDVPLGTIKARIRRAIEKLRFTISTSLESIQDHPLTTPDIMHGSSAFDLEDEDFIDQLRMLAYEAPND